MAKYDPLRAALGVNGAQRIEMSFAEIDRIVGGLPKSAYEYPAWWANEKGGNHVHAHAWQGAGYKVDHLNLQGQRVRFVKALW